MPMKTHNPKTSKHHQKQKRNVRICIFTPSGVYFRNGTQTPRSISSCSKALFLPLSLLLSCNAFALTLNNFDGFLSDMNWVLLNWDLKRYDFGKEEKRGEEFEIEREGDEFVVQLGDMNSMMIISQINIKMSFRKKTQKKKNDNLDLNSVNFSF